MAHPTLRRSPRERFLARLRLGPPGHLYGFTVDLGEALARYWAGRVRARYAARATNRSSEPKNSTLRGG